MSSPARQFNQPGLFDEDETAVASARTSTFVDNMAIPVHRWFRYSAGFSALWVKDMIQKARLGGEVRVGSEARLASGAGRPREASGPTQ
jgi:hypothetical protein